MDDTSNYHWRLGTQDSGKNWFEARITLNISQKLTCVHRGNEFSDRAIELFRKGALECILIT